VTRMTHCRAKVSTFDAFSNLSGVHECVDRIQLLNSMKMESLDVHALYKMFDNLGLRYGKEFRLLSQVKRTENACICTIALNASLTTLSILSPCVLDNLFQSLVALVPQSSGSRPHLPFFFEDIFINIPVLREWRMNVTTQKNVEGVAWLSKSSLDMTEFDCALLTQDGSILMVIKGACSKSIGKSLPLGAPQPQHNSDQQIERVTSIEKIKNNSNDVSESSIETMSVAIEKEVKKLVTDVTDIPWDTSLLEMGIDSLGATDLSLSLSKVFQVELSPILLFNYPTIDSIAEHIYSLLNEALTSNDEEVLPMMTYNSDTKIYITGVGIKLPGDVSNFSQFWSVLKNGVTTSSTTPLERWDSEAVISSLNQKAEELERIKYGCFLSTDMLDKFDYHRYGISGSEAEKMDPSQRMAVEVCHEALRDAGFETNELSGGKLTVGVYIAVSIYLYLSIVLTNLCLFR
jgi:acyl carrier protein